MQNVVIDKPYVPVTPYPGRWSAQIMIRLAARVVRKSYGIVKFDVVHADRLAASLRAGHGILLAPNHSRDEDPLVLHALSLAVKTPFFIMASWHLFMQGKFRAFLLRRGGAFSIYREGVDRAALNTAIDILESAQRPLVMFPEGFIGRTNDRLNELMDGVAMIARNAAKKREKATPPGKVVVHPIAIRYHFLGDVETCAANVLNEIEARLSWQPQKRLPMFERIQKVGSALLTLKEIEYIGHPQPGDIGERLTRLIDAILGPLEDEWTNGRHDDHVVARVKRLRSAILPDMVKGELPEPERQRRWNQLTDIYVANMLFHYPPDYVRDHPTPDRILETIERFEEDLTDKVRVHGEHSATITVGEAIEVSPKRERGDSDPLLTHIESQLKSILGIETDESNRQDAKAPRMEIQTPMNADERR
jgi:1-acyl-sn-glycerol-3-phosphate acyltransferase